MDESVLKFCPKCNSLFNYTSDEAERLQLLCKSCGFKESTERAGVIHVKFVQEADSGISHYALPHGETKHEVALFRTTKLKCPNMKCPSLDVEQWKEDGTNLPVTYLLNQPQVDRSMYMLCSVCSTSWTVKAASDQEGGDSADAEDDAEDDVSDDELRPKQSSEDGFGL